MTRSTTVPSSDGVQVVVHDLGGDGPPLLLVHATGFHGRVWDPVAAVLSADHRCLAPDLRGHGDTPAPTGFDFHWDAFADDVLAVVDGLGLQGCFAAGHSKGGASLVLAEQRRPGTFGGLWLYEPVIMPPLVRAGRDDDGANPLAEGALRRRATFASFDDAIGNFASKPPLSVFRPDALRAYVEHGFAPTGDDGAVTLKCRPEHESQVYRMGGAHHAFDHLAELGLPVTVVRGAPQPMSPSGFADDIAAAIPGGRLEAHDDLGHFGPMEDPDRMAASIRRAIGARPPS